MNLTTSFMTTTRQVPLVLKPIVPYVLRGEELLKAGKEDVVSYYCLQMAMEQGLKLNDKSAECQTFLMNLMNELESMKPKLGGRSKEECAVVCEDFALMVFARADAVDKAGNADKSTAQSFYAASTFFDVLKQFDREGELQPDIQVQAKYAKWKAAQIFKAIKEGRKPTPGGVDGEEEDSTPVAHVVPPAARVVVPTVVQSSPHRSEYVAPAADLRKNFGRQSSSISKSKKADVLEFIKFAKSAVEADEIGLAIERLQSALSLLHEE